MDGTTAGTITQRRISLAKEARQMAKAKASKAIATIVADTGAQRNIAKIKAKAAKAVARKAKAKANLWQAMALAKAAKARAKAKASRDIVAMETLATQPGNAKLVE